MKRLLATICLLLVTSVSLGQTYEAVTAYATVEGHWPLQDDAGSGVIDNLDGADASTGVNTDTISTDTGPRPWLPKSLDFPGTIEVTLGETITLSTTATVAWWANCDSTAIMAVAGSSNADKVNHDNHNVRLSIDGSGGITATGVTTVGQWHHYALVINDGSFDLYVDGALETGGVSSTALPFSMVLQRLAASGAGVLRFDGRMADIIVFSEPLDAGEVSALYTGPVSGPSLPVVHYYRQQLQR